MLLAPDRRIETFGSTQFRFHLVSELMDRAGVVRIRDGRIEAQRPQIITPGAFSQLALDGFGEQAQRFARWLENNPERLAVLKYGFEFRKTNVVENIIHAPLEEAVDRIKESIQSANEPMSAIIQGVDDTWEVCLLKFTLDLIQQSAGGNMNDFRRRGLL